MTMTRVMRRRFTRSRHQSSAILIMSAILVIRFCMRLMIDMRGAVMNEREGVEIAANI